MASFKHLNITPRGVVAALATASATLAVASPASAAVSPLSAGFESGGFSEVTGTTTSNGSITVTGERAYEGQRSAKATYNGGGGNGYARTQEEISWKAGDDVWYGASFFLPSGYKSKLQGGNDLMRWDNWDTYNSSADFGGVALRSDGRSRILLGKYNSSDSEVTPAFDLPEGRWFHLEVHQKLSTGSDALTEVFLDGKKVASSTKPNSYGRTITRLRTGMVSIHAGQQTNPLTLFIDRLSIDTHQRGPAGGAPAPAPAPAPARPPRRPRPLRRRLRLRPPLRPRSPMPGVRCSTSRPASRRSTASTAT